LNGTRLARQASVLPGCRRGREKCGRRHAVLLASGSCRGRDSFDARRCAGRRHVDLGHPAETGIRIRQASWSTYQITYQIFEDLAKEALTRAEAARSI
jgi:hypothetical protein